MIKKIFFPEKINSYYLFSQRIVAFEVGPKMLYASVIRAHRNKRSIQNFIEEPYIAHEEDSLNNAIKNILAKVGNYDSAYIALPSNIAVFKSINVPFTTIEKIRLVLPFEIEPHLPFALHDAAIDAIINKTDKENNRSDVFVTAIKQSILDKYINPFLQAGIQPTKVTVDTLELYGLTQTINEYKTQNGVSVLLDLDKNFTRIMLLVDGAIKTIRLLPQGIDEELMRLDLGVGTDMLSSHTQKFFSDIQFTIQATLKNENIREPLKSILLSGSGAHITGITGFINNLLNCSCKVFHAHKIIQSGNVSIEQGSSIPAQFTASLATALSSQSTEQFNLGRQYQAEAKDKLFNAQLITAGSFLLLILISFFTYSFLSTRKIKNEINASKDQIVKRLQRELQITTPGKKSKSLAMILNTARQKLTTEATIWFALSTSNRHSFLHYLQELTTRINRDALGLNMKRITIKSNERSGEDTLVFEGNVRDYDALRKLEEDLQDSQLFISVPKLQETKFTIPLVIDKAQKDNG